MDPEKPYHHGDLRAVLLQTAFECLEAEGIENLSIRSLASRAGVSKTAPYRHFKDKEALLASLMAVAMGDLADTMEAVLVRAPDDQLMAGLARAYMDLARKRPALFRLTFSHLGMAMGSPDCLAAGERSMAALEKGVRRVWKTEPQGGWQQMVLAQWAYIHGLCTLVLDGMIAPDTFAHFEEGLYGAFAKPNP